MKQPDFEREPSLVGRLVSRYTSSETTLGGQGLHWGHGSFEKKKWREEQHF